MERDELAAWLRLALTPGVGNGAARRLLAAFGLPQAVFAQTEAAWQSCVTAAHGPRAGRRARGAARGHRGLHVQPRRRAAAGLDSAAAGQSAGLERNRHGTAPMDLRRREGLARAGCKA